MAQFGSISYSVAALFFLFLGVLIATRWRGRGLEGGFFLSAVLLSAAWGVAGAVVGSGEAPSLHLYLSLEVLRNTAWMMFLSLILGHMTIGPNGGWKNPALYILFALPVVTLIVHLLPQVTAVGAHVLNVDIRILGHVLLAVVGLVLVEQVFRNTRLERRWALKHLCFGLGVLFAFDFVLFSEALLFGRVDLQMWNARGVVNALVVPFLAVSASRNPQWSLDIFVSRSMVFHSTGLVVTGLYLLGAALAGYYIRDYGGSWGRVGQILFLFAAVLVLLPLVFSGGLRARVRVFLSRHFFAYKYDYRKEWLDLNRTIAEGDTPDALRVACIRGIADIVDSPAGLMWVKRHGGQYELCAGWNIGEGPLAKVSADNSLILFLSRTGWVVEVPEYLRSQETYEGLDLYDWYEAIPELWLIIPLMHQGALYGLVGLSTPRAGREINWEDHDLLKTVGQQLASYVGLVDASDELASARQFEAYNRMSAFIVHDLKNLVAQLSLIVTNAAKHKRNPDFVDDVVDTLSNSVDKMNRLLAQLRKGDGFGSERAVVKLSSVLGNVAKQQSGSRPLPELEINDEESMVAGEGGRLVAVLGHLVQNAQDATSSDGFVRMRLSVKEEQVKIEIIDNGMGMNEDFIRNRLFKPFDTTKGNAGMGIGVFEARQVALALGGELSVESEPGKGSTFCMSLPLYQGSGDVE